MKNKTHVISLFVVACSVALLCSCSGSLNPAKLFVQKWQMRSFKSASFDNHIAMLKHAMDTTKDSNAKAYMQKELSQLSAMVAGMTQTVLTSNIDGSCSMTFPNPMSHQTVTTKGKWQLIDGNKKLVMIEDKNPKPDTLDIEKLTSDSLIFSVPDGQGGKVMQTYTAVK